MAREQDSGKELPRDTLPVLTAFHFEKYHRRQDRALRHDEITPMHIVTRKHLVEATELYPDAKRELEAWYRIAASAQWRSFVEIRQVFPDADAVDGYVLFNIRQNRYRLVTIPHYAREKDDRITQGHIYIRAFLTHRQYNTRANWDKGVKR